jgi:CheY-like chemotaxis protein
LLGNQGDPKSHARAREVIDRQLRHLVRLVDDLLDVTRIASNKLQLRKQLLRLDVIVQQAVESAAPNFERGRQRFIAPLLPPDVWLDADPDRMVQVLTNLLNNASKFTPPGGRVSLAVEANDAEVTLRVSDTGIGVKPDDQARVFDLFVQVSDAGQTGLGIGLALVKGTVELHGGRVEVESAGPGAGSTFSVRLPRAQAPERHPRQDDDHFGGGDSRRILVVDDNVDAADMMRALLELSGHQVLVAHDGPAALEAAAGFKPHIGLLDIGLPTMDGYELARRIRAEPATRSMFLVAVTGWGQAEDRQRSREHGFDAHLTKPADPDAVLRLIARAASVA